MIGYALLVLIALVVTIVGFIVVGVAVWGWKQEKKKPLASQTTGAQPNLATPADQKP